MKVIIDTNALMIPVQFNVDIFQELKRLGYNKFLVPKAVLNELETLMKKSKGSDKAAAKVARSLGNKCEIINQTGIADEVIIKLANELDSAVLTNDIELKKRLMNKKIPVIYLRQKNRLEKTP
ncbi:DNA-binding protein [Methanohalobium sp.]|uniref:DNA-binding protein n=1 Tax=Methanohalobium sp. TaxID=2837493 RepID=UPI0025FA45A4|nr:DNA-binding protein [Methanohalobium sp.]